jgi:hypothetical protein
MDKTRVVVPNLFIIWLSLSLFVFAFCHVCAGAPPVLPEDRTEPYLYTSFLILNQQQTLHREGRRYRGGARAGHVAQSGLERLVEQGLLLVARRRRETTGAKVGGSGGGGGGAAGAASDAGVGVRGLECAITVID